jgi:hypothetical protein
MAFDASRGALANFYDVLCFGAVGCFTLPVGGGSAMTLSTGHTLVMAPTSPGAWNAKTCSTAADCTSGKCAAGLCGGSGGFGALMFINFGSPATPLSKAWIGSDSSIQGDPLVVEAHFTLLADATPSSPFVVQVGAIQGASAGSLSVNGTVKNGVIVTSAP